AGARLSVADGNRAMLAHLGPRHFGPLADACARLLAASSPPAPGDVAAAEPRLVWVHTALLLLSNLAAAAAGPPTSARRYTRFRVADTNGRRAAPRLRMPFTPTSFVAAAVPPALAVFRKRLAQDTALVRALLEMAVAAADAQVLPDTPVAELAERAVFVLQMLHPDHDALFAARWADWVVDRVACRSLPRALTESLCELVGFLPVNSLQKSRR
ncbi:hypothetical protein LPJ66_011585, partial [Kickxella alabastrina]